MKQRLLILIIDDLEKKRQAITRALGRRLKYFEVVFDNADRYETALEKLRTRNYDFVVLDIKIPAGGEPASEKWSRYLLQEIMDGRLCYPMHVFGLTEHKEIADTERQFYDSNLFGFFIFDWESEEWATGIASKIEYLANAIRNGASYRLNSFDYDLLVLTARYSSEFKPVQKALFGSAESLGHPLWKDEGHFGELMISSHRLRTALLCVIETGLAPAAAVATQAIHILRPKRIVMLGMCAGFETKGVKIMDVLVASSSACWQEGKLLGDESPANFDPRGKIRHWSDSLGRDIERQLELRQSNFLELLEGFSRKKEYLELSKRWGDLVAPQPSVRAGLVVSGSTVVASEQSAKDVLHLFQNAIGLDMEIFAVYTAAFKTIGHPSEIVAIKGVADLADNEKRDDAQVLASELSAEVLKLFLTNLSSPNQE
jgi:nucleoside phosphorylase/CheY-like chemotaxis protein